MAASVSPFCSMVCKLSKCIWLLGALLQRNTVIDFLMHYVLGLLIMAVTVRGLKDFTSSIQLLAAVKRLHHHRMTVFTRVNVNNLISVLIQY